MGCSEVIMEECGSEGLEEHWMLQDRGRWRGGERRRGERGSIEWSRKERVGVSGMQHVVGTTDLWIAQNGCLVSLFFFFFFES